MRRLGRCRCRRRSPREGPLSMTKQEVNWFSWKYEWAIEIRPKTPGKNARTRALDFWVGCLARGVVLTASTAGAPGVPVIWSSAFPACPHAFFSAGEAVLNRLQPDVTAK